MAAITSRLAHVLVRWDGMLGHRISAMPALDGRRAIVTGGATLIGRAVVRSLHEVGASVAVADIDEEGGRSLADELGERMLFVPTDLRHDAQIDALVARTVERFGGLNILVNLATSYVDE